MTDEDPGPFTLPGRTSPWQTDVYEADFTPVRRITYARGRSFTDEENLSSGGSGAITVPMHEAAAADVAALSVHGRLVVHSVDGDPKWCGRVDPWDKDPIGADAVDEVMTLQMVGHLSEWGETIVDIPPGSGLFDGVTQRLFGWMSIESDNAPGGSVILDPTLANPKPDCWPDPFSSKLRANPERYFQRRFTLASTVVAVPYVSGESQINTYIDGVPLGTGEAAPGTSSAETFRGGVMLGPGTHIIAVEDTSTTNATRQMSCSVWTGDPDAIHGRLNLSTFLFHTGINPATSIMDPWGVSATPLGPTPGRVLRAVLEESQARGRLLGWTLSCTDTHDSNGQPWNIRINELSVAVGSYLDALLDQLTAVYCDIGTHPTDLVLDVFNWRTRGNFSDPSVAGVEYTGAEYGTSSTPGRQPNILTLGLSKQSQKAATYLRVITANEMFWFGTPGGIEGFLDLSDYTDHDTATAIANAQIEENLELGLEIAATPNIRPTNGDDTPSPLRVMGPWIGDSLRQAMDNNSVDKVKLKGVICNESTDGLHRPLWTLEPNSITVEEEERTARDIARITPAGLSNSFLPVSAGATNFGTGVTFGALQQVQGALFSNDAVVVGAISQPFPFDTPSRIYQYAWGLQTQATTDMVVGVYLNGNQDLTNLSTLIAVFTIPAGSGVGGSLPPIFVHYTNQVANPGDYAQAKIVSGGAGGDGLVVNIFSTSQI